MALSKSGILLLAVAALLPVACSSPPAGTIEAPVTVEVTRVVEVTRAVEVTRIVEVATGGEEALSAAPEYALTEIPLTEPAARRDAEISGMAWYGDYLILSPQYPDYATDEGDGFVFALSKADILAFLDGATGGPLDPIQIPFNAPGLADEIAGFEGYEAIVFNGDTVYVSVEVGQGIWKGAHLVMGVMAPDLSGLELDTTAHLPIDAQSDVSNISEEALIVAGDRLVTIYEANGAGVTPAPLAHLVDLSLSAVATIPFPNIEYRITDATALDGDGRFWAINYFYPGDNKLLPASDPLVDVYGQGATHAASDGVERLVEFQYSQSGVTLVDRPPIQLELLEGDLRNWEGIVRLDDRGFLIVTDKFPQTILAFVPLPEGE